MSDSTSHSIGAVSLAVGRSLVHGSAACTVVGPKFGSPAMSGRVAQDKL